MATDDYITTDDAARIIGVSIMRIRQLCDSGQLVAKKWGRQWMVSQASAEGFERKPAGRPAESDDAPKAGKAKPRRKPGKAKHGPAG